MCGIVGYIGAKNAQDFVKTEDFSMFPYYF